MRTCWPRPVSSRAIERGDDPGGHEEHRAHARHRHVQEDRARAANPAAPTAGRCSPARARRSRGVARAGGPRGTRGTSMYTRRGLSSCSASKPMPSRSVTPGRNVSTSTSASAASCRNASAPAWLLQVDGHRAPRPVPDRVAAVLAERVAAGRLDLDHVGALLGEQQHAERARDPPRQIEHAHPVQGTGHMAAPSCPNGRGCFVPTDTLATRLRSLMRNAPAVSVA